MKLSKDGFILVSHFIASSINRNQCAGVIFGTPGIVYLHYSPAVLLSVYAVFCLRLSAWLYLSSNYVYLYITLTNTCCVHSNVYGLGNIRWIRYLTAVDPLHSTSSAVHTYHHFSSGSVEIPVWICSLTRNNSSIGKEPVPKSNLRISIRLSATLSWVSSAEQGICIVTTNVLQGHTTVVLVCCTSEWEPDITCTWKVKNVQMLLKMIFTNNYSYLPKK